MDRSFVSTVVSLLFVCLVCKGNAVTVDTVGREFVFAYPTPYYPTSSYRSYRPYLYLVVTNPTAVDCSVSVSMLSTDLTELPISTRSVTNSSPANITISFTDYFGSTYSSTGAEDPKTIKVVATGDVSVYAYYSYNQRYSTWFSTGAIIMPVTALGKEYFIASYQPVTGYRSEFTVTALNEPTSIRIRGKDGYRNTQTLQPYQTFQYRSKYDLTGSSVIAEKPVSVVSGVSSAKIPDTKEYASYLMAHLPSVDALGNTYVLSPFKDRTSGYVYRVVGTDDNSLITIGSGSPIELHAGERRDGQVTANNVTLITSTKPILVYQFSKGFSVESSKGNAAMVVVPATEMFASSVTFPVTSMPTKSTSYYSVSITIKCEASAGLMMDGSVLAQVWDSLTAPNGICIKRATIQPGRGSHIISHTSPEVTFSVMVYASGYRIGYAYMAGYNVRSRTPIIEDNSTLTVPDTNTGMSILCEDNQMTIFVNKSLVIDGQPSDVHLNDAFCFGRLVGKTWIRLSTLFTECGTVTEESVSGSTYKNTLIYEGPSDVIIGRDATFELPLTCGFHDRALASLRVAPQLSVIDGSLSGHGALANVTFQLQMYHTKKYNTAYRQDDFPVTVHVGKPIYLEATVDGGKGIQVMAESCLATHSSDPRQKPNYIFVDDGCPTDETVTFYSGDNPSIQRFSLLAFTLSDGDNPTAIAYIHCWLLACNVSEPSSRCSRDCDSRGRRDTGRAPDSDHYVVSWGPLIILPDSTHENTDDTAYNFAPVITGMVFFLIGIILALVGVAAYQRRKQTPRSSRWYDDHDDTYELLKMEEPYE